MAQEEAGGLDFLAVLGKVERQGHLETARRLAQICGQVTRYARLAGMIVADPASHLTEALTTKPVRHHAAITEPREIGALLRAIDDYPGDVSVSFALKIMPYVFVRSSELRRASWTEIDLDRAEWLIPAERMKMRRPHLVPLARQVVGMFRALHAITGNRELVFPGTASVTRCISDVGLLNALRRLGYGRDEMTVHGFRSTASTRLNEMGYRPDVIEAQLAHAEKNSVRDAYNRAQYVEERRRMMQEWADYLDSLRDGEGGNE